MSNEEKQQLVRFVEAVDAEGGVMRINRWGLSYFTLVNEPESPEMGETYIKSCLVLGRQPLIQAAG